MASYSIPLILQDQASASIKTISKNLNMYKTVVDNSIKQSMKLQYQLKNVNSTMVAAEQINIYNEPKEQKKSFADKLFDKYMKVKEILGQIATKIKELKKYIDVLDNINLNRIMLDSMTGSLDESVALQKEMYKSAQRLAVPYQDLLKTVSTISSMEGIEINSPEEALGISELLMKSYLTAGYDSKQAAEFTDKMVKSMSDGYIRLAELNSQEFSPAIKEAILDYTGMEIGDLFNDSDAGIESAHVLNAIIASADKINEKYAELPKTFNQILTMIKNAALMAFTPVAEAFSNMINSESFMTVVNGIVQGIQLVAAIINDYVFPVISSFINWVADNLEYIKLILLALGITAAIVGAVMAIAWIIQAFPIILVVGAILLLLKLLDDMGITASQVIIAIAEFFGYLFGTLMNGVIVIYNFIMMIAEALINAFKDVKDSIGKTIASLCNYILDLVLKVADVLDKVFGTGLSEQVENVKDTIKKWSDDKFNKERITLERKDIIAADEMADLFGSTAGKFLNSFNLEGLGDFGGNSSWDDVPSFDGNVNVGGGNLDSVGRIDSEVEISEDDIKLLKDIALKEFQITYQQITPSLVANFGDIRETADAGAILEFVEDSVAEALTSNLILGV